MRNLVFPRVLCAVIAVGAFFPVYGQKPDISECLTYQAVPVDCEDDLHNFCIHVRNQDHLDNRIVELRGSCKDVTMNCGAPQDEGYNECIDETYDDSVRNVCQDLNSMNETLGVVSAVLGSSQSKLDECVISNTPKTPEDGETSGEASSDIIQDGEEETSAKEARSKRKIHRQPKPRQAGSRANRQNIRGSMSYPKRKLRNQNRR